MGVIRDDLNTRKVSARGRSRGAERLRAAACEWPQRRDDGTVSWENRAGQSGNRSGGGESSYLNTRKGVMQFKLAVRNRH